MRLRADHVEYNRVTSEAIARGHVIFDYDTQHLECDEGQLNISTGHGMFKNVHGTVRLERSPNASLLLSQNPLLFRSTGGRTVFFRGLRDSSLLVHHLRSS